MNVWVKDASAPFESAHALTADTLRPIRNYFWSRDGKYILYVQDKGGDENFNVYAVSPSDKPAAGQDIPINRALLIIKECALLFIRCQNLILMLCTSV